MSKPGKQVITTKKVMAQDQAKTCIVEKVLKKVSYVTGILYYKAGKIFKNVGKDPR